MSLMCALQRDRVCYGYKHMSETTTLDPNITMRELLEIYPGAQRALFRKYHIGGCSSCGFSPDETLAQICARNENLPVSEVIEHIQTSHEEDLRMQINPGELAELLQNGLVKLLDIRTREEFDAARIEGAELFNQDLMQEILSKWDRQTRIVIVDHQGQRGLDAASYFAGHGFANIKSLRGGIDAWSREIDPSVPRYELE
jgi:rhodanese-related sulfurtransferase